MSYIVLLIRHMHVYRHVYPAATICLFPLLNLPKNERARARRVRRKRRPGWQHGLQQHPAGAGRAAAPWSGRTAPRSRRCLHFAVRWAGGSTRACARAQPHTRAGSGTRARRTPLYKTREGRMREGGKKGQGKGKGRGWKEGGKER